jgi:hypothetical protein
MDVIAIIGVTVAAVAIWGLLQVYYWLKDNE